MDNYPKIYSVSTVGVRQHENADYLLHSVRTDFTGNNGLGKSIIADLLQLIFVPLRDEWKPGTEGLDKDKRKIESIPLNKNWIQFAYSFLNIEKAKGKFLTIGVFIPNTSRVPVRPFIIQEGENFETKNSRLKPFGHILKASDFIADTGHIFELKALKRHLYDSYKIHLKDFFNRDEVDNYFDLLFKNQLLPIDLTKEVNLKSFAKVLQSFSRAKTLDINKSKSLQDFLFEDNEEIKATFDSRREVLNEHIRNYHKSKIEIDTLEQKQSRLENLKRTSIAYENAKQEYLSKNAHLLFNIFKADEKIFKDNEIKLAKAIDDYQRQKQDYEGQCHDSFSKMVEQKEICNRIRIQLEEQAAEAGKQNIETLKQKLRTDANYTEKLEKLMPMIEQHKTIAAIQAAFANHEKQKEERKKLEALKGMPFFNQYKKSKWSEDYAVAYHYYNKRNQVISETLETLKEVLDLYDGTNQNSLFSWAIKNNEALSIEQETVVMNLKEIYIKKVAASHGKKYTINPARLSNSFEREGEGIWLNLGDVSEYFDLVQKQIFNNKGKLQQAVENDKENIKSEMAELERERIEIVNLNRSLINIGYNQDYFEIYKRATELEHWQADRLFTEDNIDFTIDNFRDFSRLNELKNAVLELNNKIDKIVGDVRLIEGQLDRNKKVLTTLLTKYLNDIKQEVNQPVDTTDLALENLTTEKLIEIRDENEDEIVGLEKVRVIIRGKRDEQKRIVDDTTSKAPSLRSIKDHSEKVFNEAKLVLEEETEIKFDNQLQMGNVTQEIVDGLKLEYETHQNLYHSEYISVAGTFEESMPINKNPEIFKADGIPYFNFQSIVNLLCGKIGLENLTNKLSELNDNLKTLGELQLKILTEVFTMVEKQYNDFEKIVMNLNFFFDKNKISDNYKFRVEFSPRKDINIDWIQKMKDKARVHKHGVDLFTNPEDVPSAENTPDNLIRNIAKQFYSAVNPEPSNLLDPKYYFTISVKMQDDDGAENLGSGGQTYTALALLCIGRLSIVQKHQENNPGVRFIIIEELSNIDDTNFSIFPQIAKKFGYQLITMTPKPFGSYTDEEWYLHMLVKGKEDKFRNYTPMSFFKTKLKNVQLEKYLLDQNELEGL
jgi:DNA repair protein SbcC/Rad50